MRSSRVLSTGTNPLWREADLMNNLGFPVIGLGARSPEYADLPLQWMPHIQVADVGASVERAYQEKRVAVARHDNAAVAVLRVGVAGNPGHRLHLVEERHVDIGRRHTLTQARKAVLELGAGEHRHSGSLTSGPVEQ